MALVASAAVVVGCKKPELTDGRYQGMIEYERRDLAFELPGRVAQVAVARGQELAPGALIARQDDTFDRDGREVRARDVAVAEADLALVYMSGGIATLVTAQVIGRLADRYGKKRVFTAVALASTVPIVTMTHLPALPLAGVLAVSTSFFVLVPGRFGPAMALVSGSAEPRVRGSFMSFNAAVMQAGSGLAASVAGVVVARGDRGALEGFDRVGWIAVGFTLVAVVLAWRVRVVDTRAPAAGAAAPPE